MENPTARQLKAILERDEDVRLINVLPEGYFSRKHIPGSLNVPLEKETFVERVESLVGGKRERLVVYCADAECSASTKARRKLERAGFTDVAEFEGGLAAWEDAGYAMEGELARA